MAMARQLWLLRHADAEPHGTRADSAATLDRARQASGARRRPRAGAHGASRSVRSSPAPRRGLAKRPSWRSSGQEPTPAELLELHPLLAGGVQAREALELLSRGGGRRAARCWSVTSPTSRASSGELTGGRVDLKKGGLAIVRLGAGGAQLIPAAPRRACPDGGRRSPRLTCRRRPAARFPELPCGVLLESRVALCSSSCAALCSSSGDALPESCATLCSSSRAAPSIPPRSGSRCRSECGCSATRRGLLELLAQLAHEHVHRAVAAHHRVAPQARIDLLALQHTALRRQASSSISSNSRRVSSRLLPPTNAWKRSERISTSPAITGFDSVRPLARRRRRTTPLHASDDLLGVTWLGDPVVGAQAQPAHALGDRRGARADDDAQLRQGAAESLEPLPGLRAEHRQVDHQRAEAHRDDGVGRDRAREHTVLPAETVHALAENLDEAAVAVEHRDAQR